MQIEFSVIFTTFCRVLRTLGSMEEASTSSLLVYTPTWLVRKRVCVVFSVGLHIHLTGMEESLCCVLCWFTHTHTHTHIHTHTHTHLAGKEEILCCLISENCPESLI